MSVSDRQENKDRNIFVTVFLRKPTFLKNKLRKKPLNNFLKS